MVLPVRDTVTSIKHLLQPSLHWNIGIWAIAWALIKADLESLASASTDIKLKHIFSSVVVAIVYNYRQLFEP